jgi:preprotein translocase subunit SecE
VAVVKDSKQESGIGRWVRETRGELRKVVWPTREEAIRLTYIVIGIALFMGLILGLTDLILSSLYTLLIS